MRLVWWSAGILLLLSILGSVNPAGAEAIYVPHHPIIIDGDAQYGVGPVPNAAMGVVRGSGTSWDPYVIEGWMFLGDASGSNLRLIDGITIRDASHTHVIIQNNWFQGLSAGVRLSDTAHVTIRNNVFVDVSAAVFMISGGTDDISVVENTFQDVLSGVRMDGDSWDNIEDVTITGNDFDGVTKGAAVRAARTSGLVISENIITDFVDGIDCFDCSSVTIDHNTIQDNDVGIDIRFGDGVITDNEIRDNRIGIHHEFAEFGVQGNNVRGNSESGAVHNGAPIYVPDFTQNYWGSALGPGPCEGCGDNVTGLQESEYEPYLLLPNEAAGA